MIIQSAVLYRYRLPCALLNRYQARKERSLRRVDIVLAVEVR